MPNGIESLAESLPGGDTKLGGKSIYLYGFVIAGVVLVYLWWNARGTNPVADAVAEDTLPSVGGDLGDLPKAAQPNTSTDDTTNTNFFWETQAVQWLVSQGIPFLSAQTAIEKYLGGETLTQPEAVIVNKAGEKFGTPPESLLTRPETSNPTPVGSLTTANWTPYRKSLVTVGGAHRVHADLRPYNSTPKTGTKVTVVQKATVSGVVYVRTLSGAVYRLSDLAEPAPAKPKAKAK